MSISDGDKLQQLSLCDDSCSSGVSAWVNISRCTLCTGTPKK